MMHRFLSVAILLALMAVPVFGADTLQGKPPHRLTVTADAAAAGIEVLKPPEVWKDYDPNQGAYEEDIVKQWDDGNTHFKDVYISAYVSGQKIRMFCQYAAEKGAAQLPAMLCIHGWMGSSAINREFLKRGYAVMSYDYCGDDNQRTKNITKYPPALKHGNMLLNKNIPRPNVRATSDYLWDALARRAVSYLASQPEVDEDRLGANGFSYGGTVVWSLGMDRRVKAIASFHGVGWNKFHRGRVHKYDLKPSGEKPSEEDEVYMAGIAPEAYPPYIHCPVLFLNGSNDHHGNQDRSYDTLNRLPKGLPWACAQQVRGHHQTDTIRHDLYLWMDKWVKGEDIVWPDNPNSEIKLGKDGVPLFVLNPDSPEEVESVEIYYALKEPFNTNRNWRNTEAVKVERVWTAKMPIVDPQMYLFAYANVRYKSTIVLSSDFEAVVPARIGKAIATDKTALIMYQGSDGPGCWAPPVIEAVGPDGIKGFKPSHTSFWTDQPNDPKWQAPEGSGLRFKVFSKETNTLTIKAGHFSTEVTIKGVDQWQTVDVQSKTLKNHFDKSPLASWNRAKTLRFEGRTLTEMIFTDFEWVE